MNRNIIQLTAFARVLISPVHAETVSIDFSLPADHMHESENEAFHAVRKAYPYAVKIDVYSVDRN